MKQKKLKPKKKNPSKTKIAEENRLSIAKETFSLIPLEAFAPHPSLFAPTQLKS